VIEMKKVLKCISTKAVDHAIEFCQNRQDGSSLASFDLTIMPLPVLSVDL
jgi:hypothetical protein